LTTARLHWWLTGIAAAVILFLVLFCRLGAPSFWDPDEAHYAETTRELLATGDWWAPYYNEQVFFDKPIFFHQLQAAAMLLAGQNELGARLVPALAALALVAATAWVGTALISLDVGVLAALLMATNPGLFALARYAILDTVFTALLFGGVGLLAVAALQGRTALQYPGYLLVAGAVLIKGPLALGLCGLTLAAAAALSPDLRRRLLALRWALGLGIIVALSAPWFAYMYRRFGESFIQGYVLDENIRLYAAHRFGKQPGPLFYVQILATGLLPWTGLLVGRAVDDARRSVQRRSDGATGVDAVERLLWIWSAVIVGFFTCSSFKLDHYVFPAAPALCLLCARAWTDLRLAPLGADGGGARIGARLVGPFLLLLGVAIGAFMLMRLDLPRTALVVPAVVVGCGTWVTVAAARGRRLPRVPWLPLTAVTVTFAGVLVFVMPALERKKVVPDVAAWVTAHAAPDTRVATYQLNRWNTAFRFYVGRHTAMMDAPEEAAAFFEATGPFYCVMLEPAYEAFVARGVPLEKVYVREGMWATSGRALWRDRLPPTRFVVARRVLAGEVERHAGDDRVRSEQQRPLDEERLLVVQ
jgi:4-amino-4-deoxy-L-arabinose transferase-like glycosyltransferase